MSSKQSNLKLKLIFTDRVGVVADISVLVADRGLNIVSMEVIRRTDEAHVFMEIEDPGQSVKNDALIRLLSGTRDLRQIRFIETLPQEERENRFRVVLDNISDGVLSIDRRGQITTINKIARDVYGCEGMDLVGKHINTLNLPVNNVLDCLGGKEFNNIKQTFITRNRRYRFFSTGKPIQDASNRIIGAALIARDMQEIKRLAQSMTDPVQVSFSDIIGQTAAISAAISYAQKIAATDAIVSIRGESGTGKELFARAIHTDSARPGPFVPVNCAALPEQLLESELFGYEAGAFTGGRRGGKAGLFEIAHNGTVFLDEIADMPPGSQAKILRLIQEKALRRIGGSKEIPINARIITATNKNLEGMVENKSFRQDLYYRINVLPIHITPLKERLDDIPLLVEHFLFQLASKLEKPIKALASDAMARLFRHHWPGNVRELKNVVERAAILCDTEIIASANILFSHEFGRLAGASNGSAPFPAAGQPSLKSQVWELERRIISDTLKKSRSIRAAARRLQISHTALLKKIKQLQIEVATKGTTGS